MAKRGRKKKVAVTTPSDQIDWQQPHGTHEVWDKTDIILGLESLPAELIISLGQDRIKALISVVEAEVMSDFMKAIKGSPPTEHEWIRKKTIQFVSKKYGDLFSSKDRVEDFADEVVAHIVTKNNIALTASEGEKVNFIKREVKGLMSDLNKRHSEKEGAAPPGTADWDEGKPRSFFSLNQQKSSIERQEKMKEPKDMSHTRTDTWLDAKTNLTYVLVVIDETPSGWRIDVLDSAGSHLETLEAPRALNHVPGNLRQQMKLALDKYRNDIYQDKVVRKGS